MKNETMPMINVLMASNEEFNQFMRWVESCPPKTKLRQAAKLIEKQGDLLLEMDTISTNISSVK